MTVFPEHIGRYQPRAILGHGGMATVYRAYDPLVGREIALKVMKPALRHDPSYRARFEREVRAIAALEHSAIVPVYDFGEEAGQLYIVMRLMRGGSLAEMVADGPLPLGRATAILQRIAPAIDEAHRRGIIHRDLKPANILFDAQGKAFLSDFGVAKVTRTIDRLTGSGVVGTPAYMSPEQIQGEEVVDGRSDIYGLGVILFKMLTGHNPYQAETPVQLMLKHVHDPVPHARNYVLDVPESCEAIIARAMAKQRDERYQTAQKLVDALEVVLHTQAGQLASLPLPVEDGEEAVPVEDTPILSDPVAPDLSQSQIRYWQLNDRLVRIPLRRRPSLPDQVVTIPEPPPAGDGPAQARGLAARRRRVEAKREGQEPSWQQRRIAYRQHLAGVQQELEQLRNRQRRLMRANDPPAAVLLRAGAQQPFWQRRPEEDDFLRVRVGEGSLPASFRVVPPAGAAQSEEGQAALALVAQYAQVAGVPLTIDLRSTGVLWMGGDARDVLLLANTLLVNVAFHHTPEEVQIWVLSGHAEASQRWAWLKWLPHCGALDGAGAESRLALTTTRSRALLTRLQQILQARQQQDAAVHPRPHLIIVGDHLGDVAGDPGTLPSFSGGGNATVIYLGQPQPEGAAALTVAPGGALHLQRGTEETGWKEGMAELTSAAEAERVARRLAPVQAVIPGVSAAEPPRHVRLVAMLGAQRADDVDFARLYRAAQAHADILAFPLGLSARREPVRGILDSERGRLTVAGAAGSGREHLLQALLLSLAAHYGPQHVQFIIVADKESRQTLAPLQALPHTSIFCTADDEDALAGAVAALAEARQRRDRMREEAAQSRQQAIPDLALFNYLQPETALPFLVVLLDGFRREFMAPGSLDLTAIARHGAAAGIYLIAGSERPAGLPRAWRDLSQARISCRLPTADDSYALFGRPDAATLPAHVPGRAYMQQREGDTLILCQSAQASGPPAAVEALRLAQLGPFAVDRVAADGQRERLFEHLPPPGTTAALSSDAEQLIAAISDYCRRAGYTAATPLPGARRAGRQPGGR